MSFSRVIDFIVLLVALIGILIVQTSGAVILDELRNEFNVDSDASMNQQQINDRNFTAVVKWVPTVALIGVILIVAFREFRRQRATAIRGPRI